MINFSLFAPLLAVTQNLGLSLIFSHKIAPLKGNLPLSFFTLISSNYPCYNETTKSRKERISQWNIKKYVWNKPIVVPNASESSKAFWIRSWSLAWFWLLCWVVLRLLLLLISDNSRATHTRNLSCSAVHRILFFKMVLTYGAGTVGQNHLEK